MSKNIILDKKYIILSNGEKNEEKEEGVTSSVYKVEDIKTKEIYAAKILKGKTSFFDKEKEFLTLFKDKGIKNIIKLIDSGCGNIQLGNVQLTERQYLILEYAEKKDLSKYITIIGNGFKESHAICLFLKILEGVKAIHENYVCHRDLKTKNILLDNEFNPKICDFGFSTYIKDTSKITKGTYYYVAPEVLITKDDFFKYSLLPKYLKEYNGAQVDVFALGVILFNLLTAKHSFTYPNKKDKSYKYIISHNYDNFWKQQNLNNIDLKDDFKELFVKMIEQDPQERIKINDIENFKWIKDFKEKSDKEKNDIESELYDEFLEREKNIKDLTQKTIKKVSLEDNGDFYGNKSPGGEGPFNKYNIRSFKEGKSLEYFINIEGLIKENNFMNDLYNKIEEEYKEKKEYECTIEPKDNKLKFTVTLKVIEPEDTEEEKNETIKNEITEENPEEKKDEENDEKKEGDEEDVKEDGGDGNQSFEVEECVINVELFKTKNGHLLRFLRKSGDLEEFYNHLKNMYSYAEKLI